MNIIKKAITAIKNWWAKLPDDASSSGKIDKKIIKSIFFKVVASICLVIAALATTFIAGLDTNNPLIAIVFLPFAKDIIDLLKKIATDYSSK